MTVARSVRDGDTADDRVVLTADHTDVPTADPVAADLGWNLQGGDWMHVYAELPGTMTGLDVTPWYYSTAAGQWFRGSPLSFGQADKIQLVEVRGEEKVFLVADGVTGTGTLKLWAGYSHVGRDT